MTVVRDARPQVVALDGSRAGCRGFIVGTAAEVTPVSEIGPYNFTVGDITTTLMNDYMDAVQPKAEAAE